MEDAEKTGVEPVAVIHREHLQAPDVFGDVEALDVHTDIAQYRLVAQSNDLGQARAPRRQDQNGIFLRCDPGLVPCPRERLVVPPGFAVAETTVRVQERTREAVVEFQEANRRGTLIRTEPSVE